MKKLTTGFTQAIKDYLKETKTPAYKFATKNMINPNTWYKNISGIGGVDTKNNAWHEIANTIGYRDDLFEEAF